MVVYRSCCKAGANTNLLDYDHMSYIDHVIRDTYVETSSEFLDIGKLWHQYIQSLFCRFFFTESYEVFTMGENTNGNLGHSQVNTSPRQII